MAKITFGKAIRRGTGYYAVGVYLNGKRTRLAGAGSTPTRAKAAARRKLKKLGR